MAWTREKWTEYYKNNKVEINAKSKAYREANKEASKGWTDAWCKANKEHVSERGKTYRLVNHERISQNKKLQKKRDVDSLADVYIASKLKMKLSECSPELIAIKRDRILLSRALRELNKTLKELNEH